MTVDDASLNHFEAFGGQDYGEKSMLQAVNDGCLNRAADVEVLTKYAGAAAIRALQTVDDAWLNQMLPELPHAAPYAPFWRLSEGMI